MNILGLETATDACSVALLDEQGRIFSEFNITPRQHTQYLPIMMDSVLEQSELQKSDLTHIAYTNGPGAFTGVRIATSIAQGLGIGLNIPLIPVSTLAVLAQQALDEHGGEEQVLVALDARMGETYTANYRLNTSSQLVELIGEERLIKLELLQAASQGLSAGSGFKARREEKGIVEESRPVNESIYPTAHALVRLARYSVLSNSSVSAEYAPINYIRNNVAEKKKVKHV